MLPEILSPPVPLQSAGYTMIAASAAPASTNHLRENEREQENGLFHGFSSERAASSTTNFH
jgi:hypothetical protein